MAAVFVCLNLVCLIYRLLFRFDDRGVFEADSGEIYSALGIDFNALNGNGVADVKHVFHLFDSCLADLADVKQAFLARKDLNECSEVRQPYDLDALEQLLGVRPEIGFDNSGTDKETVDMVYSYPATY